MDVPSHGESKAVEPPPAKKARLERSSLITKFVADNEANADKVLAQEIVDYVQYEKDAMDKFLKEEADVTHDMVKMLCESVASTTRLRFQARAHTATNFASAISQGYESSAVVLAEDEGAKRIDVGHIAEIARAEASANTDAVRFVRSNARSCFAMFLLSIDLRSNCFAISLTRRAATASTSTST